jgi:hypothetical protein
LSGHPVQQRQKKLLTLSGIGRKNVNPVGQRKEKCSEAPAEPTKRVAGQPVLQSQEKVLTLSGKDRKRVAEHAI